MYLVHTAVQQYKDILNSKEEFQEIERLKVQRFINYNQYGGYGFRLLFIPSPLSSFFNDSALFSDLTCHIDVGEKLNIYNSFKGEKIFSQRSGKLIDLSGVILLLGSLLALFYGYEFLRHREYLKFLSSFYGRGRSFGCFISSDIILLSLYFILIAASAAILLSIEVGNSTEIKYHYIFDFVFVMLLVLIFFFSIGTIIGITKSKFARFFIILVWVGSVYFIPAALNNIVEVESGEITSNYKYELEKLNALMEFEKRAVKHYNEVIEKAKTNKEKINIDKSIKKIVNSYLTKEFKEIQNYDSQTERKMIPLVRHFQTLSIFFPSTFYFSVNNEISSRGYKNVIQFYQYAREIKKEFVDFYTDKRADELITRLKKQTPKKVKSFINETDKNIFKSKSQLPDNFGKGILVTIFWIVCSFSLSYSLYKKSLFSLQKEKVPGLSDLQIELNKGESNVVLSSGQTMRNYLYNVLSGKNKEFSGKVVVGGVNIVEEKMKTDFVYFCHPEEVPLSIKAGDFISFIGNSLNLSKKQLKDLSNKLNLKKIGEKNFNELKEKEKGDIFFEAVLLKKSKIYIIDNFTKGMPTDFIKEFIGRLEKLVEEGASILYLTNDVFMAQKIGDYISVLKKDAALMTINI
jgi:ABC-type Na+ transport system ATPase subunit NatA/vacuolar-type H+-ATPase subunit H